MGYASTVCSSILGIYFETLFFFLGPCQPRRAQNPTSMWHVSKLCRPWVLRHLNCSKLSGPTTNAVVSSFAASKASCCWHIWHVPLYGNLDVKHCCLEDCNKNSCLSFMYYKSCSCWMMNNESDQETRSERLFKVSHGATRMGLSSCSRRVVPLHFQLVQPRMYYYQADRVDMISSVLFISTPTCRKVTHPAPPESVLLR